MDDFEKFKEKLMLANSGNRDAQREMGDFYCVGSLGHRNEQVRGSHGFDPMEAGIKWYLRAANQGDVIAQTNLAMMYSFDKEKKELCIKWYTEVAKQGDPVSQYDLATFLRDDENYKEAFKWMKRSAKQNYDPAMLSLARMYLNGVGVKKDKKKAVHWLKKISSKEYPHVAQQAEEEISQLYPDDLYIVAKELIVVIKMGDKTTTIIIPKDNNLILWESIQAGREHIVNDISQCLRVNRAHAEELLKTKGKCIAKYVQDRGYETLIETIEARVESIFLAIKELLEKRSLFKYVAQFYIVKNDNYITDMETILSKITKLRAETIVPSRLEISMNKTPIW